MALLNLPIDKDYEIRNRLSVIMDIQIIRRTIMRAGIAADSYAIVWRHGKGSRRCGTRHHGH
jgi:hypothetical protein